MNITKDKLKKLYKTLSIHEIAAKYNVTYGTIWWIMRKYNIKRRSKKYALKLHYKQGKSRGSNHWKWKGGKIRSTSGYIQVYRPRHPNAMKCGYVYEHRLVMEKYLGRYLKAYEKVHHKNCIKDDNRIKNLQIVILKNHYGEIKCPYCGGRYLTH